MAIDATKVEGPYKVQDHTVSASATISAMRLCKLTDPRTAAGTTSTDDATAAAPTPFAGISMTEKLGSDGSTNLGLAKTGVFTLTAGGDDIPAGALVVLSGTLIQSALDGDALLSGAIVGKALETIEATTAGEVDVGVIV